MRTAEDDEATRDAGSIAAAGEAAMRESRRRSSATRKGLRRRKERGSPVGAVPFGYRAEPVVVDGHAVGRRVIDPSTAPIAQRVFEMVAEGATTGEVARRLNEECVSPPRKSSRAWEPRTVSRIVENRSYMGENGYPRLIDQALFERALGNLQRLDPVAVAARKGGRKSPEEYFLRGIAKCSRCGAPLYTRPLAAGRHYKCANSRQATGLCDAPAIPANVLEARTLDHLRDFRLDVEQWLATRVAVVHEERTALERAAASLRGKAAVIAPRRRRAPPE